MYAEFQDIGNVPWQLLIRARTAAELDAVIASSIVRAVSESGSRSLAEQVAKAAMAGVSQSREAAEPAARSAVIAAAADFDDICPRPKWPPRPHHILDEFGDPVVLTVLGAARELLKFASPQLRETMASTLQA